MMFDEIMMLNDRGPVGINDVKWLIEARNFEGNSMIWPTDLMKDCDDSMVDLRHFTRKIEKYDLQCLSIQSNLVVDAMVD